MKQIIAELIKIADELDDKEKYNDADFIDELITKNPIFELSLQERIQDAGLFDKDGSATQDIPDEIYTQAIKDTIEILRQKTKAKPVVKKQGNNYVSGIAIINELGEILSKEWDYANPLSDYKTAKKYAILRAKELNN